MGGQGNGQKFYDRVPFQGISGMKVRENRNTTMRMIVNLEGVRFWFVMV